MEFAGVTQELIRSLIPLVPQPSGRPGAVSSALRRSIIISALAARNLRLHRLFLALLGGLTIAFTLSKVLLDSSSLSVHHIGVLPYMGLHLLYTLGLLVFLNPVLRKFYPLI